MKHPQQRHSVVAARRRPRHHQSVSGGGRGRRTSSSNGSVGGGNEKSEKMKRQFISDSFLQCFRLADLTSPARPPPQPRRRQPLLRHSVRVPNSSVAATDHRLFLGATRISERSPRGSDRSWRSWRQFGSFRAPLLFVHSHSRRAATRLDTCAAQSLPSVPLCPRALSPNRLRVFMQHLCSYLHWGSGADGSCLWRKIALLCRETGGR